MVDGKYVFLLDLLRIMLEAAGVMSPDQFDVVIRQYEDIFVKNMQKTVHEIISKPKDDPSPSQGEPDGSTTEQ